MATDNPGSVTVRPWQLLTLSAHSPDALTAATDKLLAYLKAQPDVSLSALAYQLQQQSRGGQYRRALVCNSVADAISVLENPDSPRLLSGTAQRHNPPVAFMFTGLGDQYIDMGLGLYQTETTFRAAVDRCAELLQPYLGLDVREVVYPKGTAVVADTEPPKLDFRRMLMGAAAAKDEASERLNQTFITQPLMFVIEYALAQLWLEWGINPQALMGYSIGEYVVACLAGVFSLDDGLMLIARRAQLMQQMPGGAMLAVPLSEAETLPLLGEQLSISAVNGPAITVVSGPLDAITTLETELTNQGLACRRLQTSHAFHSKMMEPIREQVTALAEQVSLHEPQISYVSTVTGNWLNASEALDTGYWSRHMCQAVRFADGLRQLSQQPELILMEVGPGQTLSAMAIQNQGPDSPDRQILSSLRSSFYRQPDIAFSLTTLAKLWLAGVAINWDNFYASQQIDTSALPELSLHTTSIATQQLTTQLTAHAGVKAAIVLEQANSNGQTALLAYVAPTERYAASVDGQMRYRLPNNMAIVQINRNETDHLYQDIFLDRAYFKHGIRLPEGAVIFDIGANIGMFTLFISQYCKNPTIYAFEPLPPIYQALRANARLYGSKVHTFLCGISNQQRTDRFTYYPRYSVMSGLSAYANAQEDLSVVKTVMVNERQHSADEMVTLLKHADDMFASRFEAETYDCQLRVLSDVIKEQGVEKIDLLKIDVQRAELEVLQGIAPEDWDKIEQIVAEVHDAQDEESGGRAQKVATLLTAQGYQVLVEQDELFKGTDHYNVYARRPRADEPAAIAPEALQPVMEFDTPLLSATELAAFLRRQDPAQPLPTEFIILEQLPVTRSGRLDYDALAALGREQWQANHAIASETVSAPATNLYLPLWQQTLPLSAVNTTKHWLVFADDSPLSQQLIPALQTHSAGVTTIVAGAQLSDYQAALRLLPSDGEILYLWGLSASQRNQGALLQLVQILIEHSSTNNQADEQTKQQDHNSTSNPVNLSTSNQADQQPSSSVNQLASQQDNHTTSKSVINLTVITEQAESIGITATTQPDQETMAQLLAQQHPSIRYRSIDITQLANSSPRAISRIVEQLTAELTSGQQAVVAYRGQQRWAQQLQPIAPAAVSRPTPLRQGGQYLIFGDANTSNFEMAKYLNQHWQAERVNLATSHVLSSDDLTELVTKGRFVISPEEREYLTQVGAHEYLAELAKDEVDQTINGIIYHVEPVVEGMTTSERCQQLIDQLTALTRLPETVKLNFCLLYTIAPTGTTTAISNWLGRFAESQNEQSDTRWLAVNWQIEASDSSNNRLIPATGDSPAMIEQVLPFSGQLAQLVVSKQQLHNAPSAQTETESEQQQGWHTRPKLNNAYTAPRNATEQAIAEIWQQLLKIKPIGIHDTFFELGGHSLLAIQAMQQLKDRLQVDLPVRHMFETPTIAGIAAVIAAK